MTNYPYRGKRKDNGQWVNGFLYEDTPLYCFQEDYRTQPKQTYILCPGFADWGMPRKLEKYAVEPESVGLYVGMRVKNTDGEKVELCTGMVLDLTDYHGRRKGVELWGLHGGAFYYGGDGYSDEYLTNARNIVVIGNACEMSLNTVPSFETHLSLEEIEHWMEAEAKRFRKMQKSFAFVITWCTAETKLVLKLESVPVHPGIIGDEPDKWAFGRFLNIGETKASDWRDDNVDPVDVIRTAGRKLYYILRAKGYSVTRGLSRK